MKKEFVVERQGKNFVLYAGLLDLAHQQGLTSITAQVIQVPAEENNRVAICTATVTLEKDGVTRTFTEVGDAAPSNVAPAMQTCLIRMAATRAKARALRDAVNVGAAAMEELGEGNTGDDTQDFRSHRATAPSRTPRAGAETAAGSRATTPKPAPTGEITDDQRRAIIALSNRKNVQPPDMEGWTSAQAGEYLKELQKRAA